ncbi:hypothetical protein CONPUDRAFT_149609 [Coniophora puteana RWD-64-598 SS2]|uniref:F-box domain-containing protein n=1 Tax=Coniophora puteana (strain RWD-64-598) TaxID=741705 RepID=A0A5M3N1I9_CONPW|nr:uncharacterized protein CONPUDRAFT_149609 [Coniophora puteana RWD-64-598 SS2]EIW84741.1 hypothetical protein CONPUDRAFT_149609 [Coniophora puteana RWD-64-598 SS2]
MLGQKSGTLSPIPSTSASTPSSIHKIPPEVLASIFSHCKVDGVASLRDCVRLMLVCKWWRSVFITFPYLWTRVDVNCNTPAPTVDLMLSRAGTLPLMLVYEGETDSNFLSMCSRILRELPRLRDLQLTLRAQSSRGIELQNHLSLSPSPLLQSLSLRILSKDTNMSRFHLPCVFFEGAPALRKLSLRGCNIPSNTSLLSHLTHLTLDEFSNADTPTTLEFIGFLKHTLVLEVLELHNALSRSGGLPSSWDQYPVVSLPNLKKLSTYHSFDLFADLVSRLDFPADTCVTTRTGITDFLDVSFSTGLSNTFPLVPSRIFCPTQSQTPAYSLTISLHPTALGLMLLYQGYASYDEAILERGSWPWPCRFHGNFGYFSDDDDDGDDLCKFIVPLCIALPLHHIQSIRLDIKAVFSGVVPWNELFAHTPELRVLATQLPDDHLRQLFGDLASKLPSTGMVLPHLEELHVLGFKGRGCFDGFVPHLQVTGLVDALGVRARSGFPLERIMLGADCVASDSYVEELREVVQKVHWC